MNASKKRFLAFTLAEVLITLGIIGVVASLTIPTLINNYQKQQAATSLSKIYSTISQAYKNAELELGSSTNWEDPASSTAEAYRDWWDKYFIPYSDLSIVKTCTAETTNDCWAQSTKYLDGSKAGVSTVDYYLVLKDGIVLRLWTVTSGLANIGVDINGIKSPNIVGKDYFAMSINYKQGKVQFIGAGLSRALLTSDIAYGCNSELGTYKGMYCGMLIQQDGWQIKDDYPWK